MVILPRVLMEVFYDSLMEETKAALYEAMNRIQTSTGYVGEPITLRRLKLVTRLWLGDCPEFSMPEFMEAVDCEALYMEKIGEATTFQGLVLWTAALYVAKQFD